MAYEGSGSIRENVGNKALAPNWNGALFVPAVRDGTVLDVRSGTETVFATEEDGRILTSVGLESFIRTRVCGTEAVIFDNHNHALYFWCEARKKWLVRDWVTVMHVDEHSDLWENPFALPAERLDDLEFVAAFVRDFTNVGNYVVPAMKNGFVGEFVRIEGEGDMLRERGRILPENSILNLDLDIFAPELSDIPLSLSYPLIRSLAREAAYVTIATSPFFIDQETAIGHLRALFADPFPG